MADANYTDEIWKPIPSFPTYEASSYGRIRRSMNAHPRWAGKVLSSCPNNDGYLRLGIRQNGRTVSIAVHRLVCEAFHGSQPIDRFQVAHADCNRTNNRPENLRWATVKENISDTISKGRYFARGTAHGAAKFTEAVVAEIRSHPPGGNMSLKLAEKYNTTVAVIFNLRCRTSKAWPHVPFPTK